MLMLPFGWPKQSCYRRMVEMVSGTRAEGRRWAREEFASYREWIEYDRPLIDALHKYGRYEGVVFVDEVPTAEQRMMSNWLMNTNP